MPERPNLQKLEEALRQGESEYLEFKRRFTSDAEIARTLVAFANGDGGLLLVGVAEGPRGAEVVGLSDSDAARTVDRIRHLTASVLPTPVPVGVTEIEGKRIVYASVNPVPPHLRPVTTASGQVYQRDGPRDAHVERHRKGEESTAVRAARVIRVFVAMSLREEEEPALVDYFRAMERAAERVQPQLIELVRIDRVEGDYEISAQIMEEIDRCDVVLGDFTLSPRNVYFEVGYARGAQKLIIQTARRDTALEFDIRNWKTLFYRNATELEEHLVGALADLLR